MTSLFLELVSVPTDPCFSIRTVDAPLLDCSLRAIANPTTPPPMTACVKSASLRMLDEKWRLVVAFSMEFEKARVDIITASNESLTSRLINAQRTKERSATNAA